MKMLDLNVFLAGVTRRKAQLAPKDLAREVEIFRNNGTRRTTSKRAALRRADARAKAAAIEPVRSDY